MDPVCPGALTISSGLGRQPIFFCGVFRLWTLHQSTKHRLGQRGARDPGEGAASRLIDSPKSDLVKETRSQWEAAIHQFGLEAPGGEVEEKPPN